MNKKLAKYALIPLAALLVFNSLAPALAADSPSIAVSLPTFGAGSTVSITGTGFPSGTTIKVWLDTDLNGKLDSGESYVTVTTSAAGAFATALNVGPVAVGSYNIDAGQGVTSDASTPVSVIDSSTLSAITSAISTLEGDLSTVKADLDSSITSLANQVSSFQSDLDSKLGTFGGTDSVASLLYSIQGKEPDVSAGSGRCYLLPSSPNAGCITSNLGTGSASFPSDSSITLTLWIGECTAATSCPAINPNQIEAGGSAFVTITSGHGDSDSLIVAGPCTAGTCTQKPTIQSLTFSASSFHIDGGCDKGTYGTNACSNIIVVYYSYTAISVSPTSGGPGGTP